MIWYGFEWQMFTNWQQEVKATRGDGDKRRQVNLFEMQGR